MERSYEMIQCLGRGGFGEVYLANHVVGSLSKRVAVKVLKPHGRAGSQALERMRDEARMLAALEHPAILRVHELTELAGRVALVAEYIDGVDLSRCCESTRLMPRRVVLEIIAEVAAALDCAWTTPSPDTGEPLHLVHRDVKPENIRLSKHGEVKLLDFGIAHTSAMSRQAHTLAGQTPFTPGYAPPELFGPQPVFGHFTDVYALGATCFRLLVGERFFEGVKLKRQVNMADDAEAYDAFLTERLACLPDPSLREVLAQCLAFDKEARPSAAQLAAQLHRLQEAMEGPSCARWARALPFPEAARVEGGSLTGRVLEEHDGRTQRFVRRERPEEEVKKKAPATVLMQLPTASDTLATQGAAGSSWLWRLFMGAAVGFLLAVAASAGAIGSGVLVYWWSAG